MKWIKAIGMLLFIICSGLGIVVYYVLQPAGKVSDFQAWQPVAGANDSTLSARFFGVSTLLFDDGKDQILIDGFFSRAPVWQVASKKLSSDQHLLSQIKKQYGLERTRAIFVTHSHYDHALDLPALTQHLDQVQIVGSTSSLNITRANPDVKTSQLIPVNTSQRYSYGDFHIRAIASAHTPPTAVNNDLGEEITTPLQLPAKFSEFKEGGSFDYLIEHQGQKILIKASTGYVANQYQDIQVDTLFLGIAQLSRQSTEYQTAYLKETLQAVQPKVVIPIHWDDFFQPLSQPLRFLPRIADNAPASLKILMDAAQQQGARVVLLTSPVAYPLASQVP